MQSNWLVSLFFHPFFFFFLLSSFRKIDREVPGKAKPNKNSTSFPGQGFIFVVSCMLFVCFMIIIREEGRKDTLLFRALIQARLSIHPIVLLQPTPSRLSPVGTCRMECLGGER
ncbi:hypothetical protein F4801DRAFT_517589 [Xylaria longipes]|nr:hypothetical protein F4801DRAFT_517589 [Xylaria longipes]